MRRSLGILYLMFIIYYLMMMANGIVIEKGSPLVLGVNIAFFGYLLFLNTVKNPYILKFAFIYLFLLFLLLLILNTSSEYYESLRMFAKYSIGLMAFPAGFVLLKGEKAYKNLLRLSMIMIGLFLIDYIVSSFLHLGGSNTRYGGDTSIETGNLFDDALFLNVCIIALLPLFLFNLKRWKGVIILMEIIVAAVSIACMKRMVIACMILVILVYLLMNLYMNWKYGRLVFIKRRSRFSLARKFLIAVFAILVVTLYWDTLVNQIDARRDDFNRRFEEESRVMELSAIYEDMSEENGGVALFGKETFNTVGTYADGKFGDRMIHTNVGIILNGSGFLGLVFYVSLNIYILILLFKTYRRQRLRKVFQDRLMFILYLSLWFLYTAASFSGTIWLTIYPAFSFMVMGGVLRYFHDNRNVNLEKNELTQS